MRPTAFVQPHTLAKTLSSLDLGGRRLVIDRERGRFVGIVHFASIEFIVKEEDPNAKQSFCFVLLHRCSTSLSFIIRLSPRIKHRKFLVFVEIRAFQGELVKTQHLTTTCRRFSVSCSIQRPTFLALLCVQPISTVSDPTLCSILLRFRLPTKATSTTPRAFWHRKIARPTLKHPQVCSQRRSIDPRRARIQQEE